MNKKVNKEIRDTQAELKDVEKLLKFDPKNTELLAQKQELLKKAIGETSDKLKQLKDAEAQMKAEGVEAIAVVYLHAYVNPAHEIRTKELIQEIWPEVMVTYDDKNKVLFSADGIVPF